ncbi:MAG: rod shape-determining protein RodA [Clostridia bacterium]|nr:rod shape-determining protein RodA [Clostridia bacterium]
MKKLKSIDFREVDYLLLVLTIICVIFGTVIINSAVTSFQGGMSFIIIQLCAALAGFVIMIFLTVTDYQKLTSVTKAIYILSAVFLIAVLLIGTGREDTGSRSWIRFGSIGIQPSEIVKIGFIITFSKSCSEYGDELNKPKNIFKLLIHAGVFVFLIMLQPDFGTTMVFLIIFAGILFAANISYKYIIGTGLCMAAAIPLVWNLFLQEYQKNRIRVLFDPESDPQGAGYHVMQSKIAIGSGGIFGKGLGQGTQTQLDYLPAKHTDFIYSVVGEELGIIGCVIVALLLFGLVIRCLYIAKNANTKFGSYICVGVACMFLAHTFENIGMCLGIMPVTGIPLPFFSYGGSSILTNLMAIGLVMSVAVRKKNFTLLKQ